MNLMNLIVLESLNSSNYFGELNESNSIKGGPFWQNPGFHELDGYILLAYTGLKMNILPSRFNENVVKDARMFKH